MNRNKDINILVLKESLRTRTNKSPKIIVSYRTNHRYRSVDTLPCVLFVAMHMLRRRCATVKLCAIIVALPYALFFVYAFTGYSFTQNKSFATALSAQADADNYIILVMIDEAFTDMAINFYEASLRAHRVDNYLFVGVGRKACHRLSRLSIPCLSLIHI